MQTLADALKAEGFDLDAFKADGPIEEEAPACPRCRDGGFLRPDVPASDPSFGRIVACDCTQERIEAARRARIRAAFGSEQFPHYEGMLLDDHPNVEMAREVRAWMNQIEAAGKAAPKPWLLLFGANGGGKTSAAIAVITEWMKGGKSGLFRVMPNWLQEIRDTYGTDRLTAAEREEVMTTGKLLRAYQEADVLGLDDIGASNLTERNASWIEEQVYLTLNTRHNAMRPTIMTTNLPPDKLAGWLGERVYWRVSHLSEIVWSGDVNLRS